MLTIKCPHCNYQYLPGEIFDPVHFLGQPKRVIRDSDGEILGNKGIDMDTQESFVCDHCDREFFVRAKINFIVDTNEVKEENEIRVEETSLF